MPNKLYLECRGIIKEFIKKEYWNSFTSADIFYIVDNDGKRAMLTFLDSFFGESYGIQLFNNANGFNYVHDIFTATNPDNITIGDCDSICAILVSKKDLKENEIKYLKDKKVRIKEENNLIIYRFEKGHAHRLAKPKEEAIILEYLAFLSCLIVNEYEDIIEAFKNEGSVVTNLDKINLQYSVIYRPLPYLEVVPKRGPVNKPFVDEFKDSIYINDECYCYSSYLPVVVKETNVRPIFLYFYYPKTGQCNMKYILDKPKEYKNCIWGILYDVFTSIGLPTKIYFNSRDFYYPVVKTLTEMNIETEIENSNPSIDNDIHSFISNLYMKTKDETIEEKEVLEILMDTIATIINSMDLNEDEFDDTDNDSDDMIS